MSTSGWTRLLEDIDTGIVIERLGTLDRYILWDNMYDAAGNDLCEYLFKTYPDLAMTKDPYFAFEDTITIMEDISTVLNFSLDTMMWLNKQRRLLGKPKRRY